MVRRVFLHAGKHKTGTTSIQHYLADHVEFFAANGLTVVMRSHNPEFRRRPGPLANSIEIAHTLIRPELQTPVRLRNTALAGVSVEDQRKSARQINAALKSQASEDLIISAEAFSFLRTRSERDLFDIAFDGFRVETILFLRQPLDWLASWKKQTSDLYGKFHNEVRGEQTIFNYSENSWLIEDDAIKNFFEPGCHVLSYENSMEQDGSVIPAFLKVLGLNPAECPTHENYFLNRSAK